MAKDSKGRNGGSSKIVPGPKCVAIFDAGVTTSRSYARGMIALMGDIARGSITAPNANAICRAGGELLRVKTLELKYGREHARGEKILSLASPEAA